MHASKIMKVDTSPPVREVGFLRKLGVAGPDGASPSFLMDGVAKTSEIRLAKEMRFAPWKCRLLLYGRIGSKLKPVLGGIELGEVDEFNYLGSCTSADGRIPDEVSSRIQGIRLKIINLKRMSFRYNVQLLIKNRACTVAVRLILLRDSETWLLRAGMRGISVFVCHCLRNVGRVWWERFLSYSTLGRRIFGFKV